MLSTTSSIEMEDNTITKEKKIDDTETMGTTKTEVATATKEASSSPIKTYASNTTDATTVDNTTSKSAGSGVRTNRNEKSDASKTFEDGSDDGIAKEATKSKNVPDEASTADSVISTSTATGASTKGKGDDDVENKDAEEDIQVQTENESDSDSSSTDADVSEEKSIGNNEWDNNYSNQLQRLYSNVDPATRQVAEEMIRVVQSGNNDSKHIIDIAPKIEGTPKSRSSTSNHAADFCSSAMTAKSVSAKDASRSVVPDVSLSAQRNKSNTNIKKGKEPSVLELALKQHRITQSDQLRSTQFPFRLHNMLDDAERSGHAHIVSWCSGGDSFKIHKPTKLINVLQKYFRQSKFKSFLRQLQGYNYKRITRGKDQGVVSHPLFLRGRRSVSTLMRRKRVGPKANTEVGQANNMAAVVAASATGNLTFAKQGPMSNDAVATRGPNQNTTSILPPAQFQIARSTPSSIHSAPTFLNNVRKPSSQSPHIIGAINPNPQDVLCVDIPNVQHIQQFQGNRKLASIVRKITGHYASANESVRTMIVNEISSRIQCNGSRFLKLSEDGTGWTICNREEMFRTVIKCFEQEMQGSTEKNHVDLTGFNDNTSTCNIAINKTLPGMGNPNMHGVGTSSDSGRCLPQRNQDVVLRGGLGSEREGNTYLKTMIQANVGQQLDSFEMKRIKCRAILERMKRRGSRFFLKLKETDSDDDMYMLSDSEAQDVIYTAFCAEEKKVQSILMDTPTASSMMRAKALAGLDENHPGLSGLGGASQYASRAVLQRDAALLSQMKANNDMSLLASQNSLKRPLQDHGHLSHENIIEKRLRAETDEHIKLLIERERHRRNDSYGVSGLGGRLPFNTRSAVLESSIPLPTAYGGGATTSSSIDQYMKERRVEEMLLTQAAAARTPFSANPSSSGLGQELPKSNNHFVEFLKKKYVKSAQERAW